MEKVLLVVPGLFVVMGAGTLVWLVRERLWWSGFRTRAVAVDGVVTGLRRRRASGSGTRVDFVHVPQVAYPMPDGSRQESWLRYSLDRPVAVGSPLPLQADPQHPDRVVLAGDRGAPRIAPLVVGAFLLLAGLVGLAVFSAVLS